MVFMGVDIHKSYLKVAEAGDDGKLRSRCRIMNTPEAIDKFVVSLDPGVKVAKKNDNNRRLKSWAQTNV